VVVAGSAGPGTGAGRGGAVAWREEGVRRLPPLSAGCVSVIVHVVADPDGTLAGEHASEDTLGVLTEPTVTVAPAVPPSVALTVTVWGELTDPAVAVNVTEVAAAVTVTEAGRGGGRRVGGGSGAVARA